MTVLHHFVRTVEGKPIDTRGIRIAWLLEELGLPYDLKIHLPNANGVSKTLLAASPLGKAPVLEYNGERLTESGAIIFQLLSEAKNPPPELETRISRDSMFWSHFSEGSLMMYIQPRVAVNNIAAGLVARDKGGDAQGVKKLESIMERWAGSNRTNALKLMDNFLSKHPNFSGNEQIGQADFMMSYVLNQLDAEGVDLPMHTRAWLERVRARSAWKRAYDRIRETESKARSETAKL